ncbi:MAG: ribonuclease P protein component [Candidatus Sungbacteria bacterium]|nr:ribonuclease P protein component [Candidatus Sungbacteria bacterium]
MQRTQRLAAANDFQLLFSRGRRFESALFRLVWRKNDLPCSRFVFVASKAVSKRAVIRNRLRRRVREWYGKQGELFPAPVDLALIFKKDAARATRASFYEELRRSTAILLRRDLPVHPHRARLSDDALA